MPENHCRSCLCLRGEITLSTAPRIHSGDYWVIEHGAPSSILGWIVIVLKRHCEALHELTPEEFNELQKILHSSSRALHSTLGAKKEYVMQFAEGDGFNHVHFHLVARAANWPDYYRGASVFNITKEEYGPMLTSDQVIPFCREFGQSFQTFLTGR